MKNLNLANAIFIDATASDSVVPYYSQILNSSISIITPNKIANTKEYKFYRQLRDDALKNNVQFKYSTNVGAGLPIINSLQDLVNSGEEILKIEGVLSGTLGYIFNSLNEGKSFSESVKDAKENGFTEPDPRDDLNGLDVARKLLIMIREIGINMEMKDIQIESLVSARGAKARTTEEFFDMLKEEDHKYYELVKKAKSENKVLRYVAKYENEKAEVAVETVSADHPFYRLKGVENITAITTSNHSPYPLVLRGKGAGADYTAFGIFTDIIKVSQFLG
jgi:aspartokinase/homoserine dehydrogenase 1